MKRHDHPALKESTDLGEADRSLSAGRLILILRPSPAQEAALETFLRNVQTKGSPDFHRWLTPQAFGTSFHRYRWHGEPHMAAGGAAVFHRISSGNNSVPGQSGFSASTTDPAYNQASGLGSVDRAVLVANWTQTAATTGFAPTTVTLPARNFLGGAAGALPPWAYGALGLALVGIARRRQLRPRV